MIWAEVSRHRDGLIKWLQRESDGPAPGTYRLDNPEDTALHILKSSFGPLHNAINIWPDSGTVRLDFAELPDLDDQSVRALAIGMAHMIDGDREFFEWHDLNEEEALPAMVQQEFATSIDGVGVTRSCKRSPTDHLTRPQTEAFGIDRQCIVGIADRHKTEPRVESGDEQSSNAIRAAQVA